MTVNFARPRREIKPEYRPGVILSTEAKDLLLFSGRSGSIACTCVKQILRRVRLLRMTLTSITLFVSLTCKDKFDP